MEKKFSIFQHRRQAIEDKLDVLLDMEKILLKQEDSPCVLERREQLGRKIADTREEITFLEEQMLLAEAERRKLLPMRVRKSRLGKARKA